MRFRCGKTREEKAEARRKADLAYKAQYEWHRVFAIVPHKCGDACVWLEYVERKRCWREGPFDPKWMYQVVT